MPTLTYQRTTRGNRESLFLFVDSGDPLSTSNAHWSYNKILSECQRIKELQDAGGEASVQEIEDLKALFKPEEAVNKRFQSLGGRVKVRGGVVHIDGDPVDNVLAEQIMRFLEQSLPFEPLVKFYERLLANTDDNRPEAAENSRQQLYRFLAANNFAITPDGKILGYKRVNKVTDDDGEISYFSCHAGPAVVNNEPHEDGPVPQPIGGVVAMARSEVIFDPRQTCAHGLHVSHYSYADHNFGLGGNCVLEVLVDPAMVVSIPVDSSDRKMRVCEYEVLGEAYGERTDALVLPTPAEPPAPEPEPENIVTDDDGTTHFNTTNLGGDGIEKTKLRDRPAVRRLRSFLGLSDD